MAQEVSLLLILFIGNLYFDEKITRKVYDELKKLFENIKNIQKKQNSNSMNIENNSNLLNNNIKNLIQEERKINKNSLNEVQINLI